MKTTYYFGNGYEDKDPDKQFEDSYLEMLREQFNIPRLIGRTRQKAPNGEGRIVLMKI